MKTFCFLLTVLVLAAAPALAQKADYLTPEEVDMVRETQEPDMRIALFLQFAQERLVKFDMALLAAGKQERPHYDELRDRLNDFIHAVDDAAATLDLALERGGSDLRKTRKLLDKQLAEFLDHIEQARKAPALEKTDIQYDLEDATIALQDFQETSKTIPDKLMPLKQPRALESEEKSAAPAKPTLKRRPEQEEERKPPH